MISESPKNNWRTFSLVFLSDNPSINFFLANGYSKLYHLLDKVLLQGPEDR